MIGAGPVGLEFAQIFARFGSRVTIVSHGTQIENAEIEHSIVLENSRIASPGQRIEDSLIGRNVEVVRAGGRPAALRLLLGDDSQISLT